MAFVTQCDVYMGIEPHFDIWNHFFRVWLPQDSDAEAAILGGVDIYVKSGHRVDP
jgi:fibrillarin-like rRNA methylase